jgi:hypothetical protein
MLAETPSETHSFLTNTAFLQWLSQHATIPLDYGPSLFDCLSEFLNASFHLGVNHPIPFELLPLLLSPIQSLSISDQLLLESCLNFLTSLSGQFSDYCPFLVSLHAFQHALSLFQFASALLPSQNLCQQLFAHRITCAVSSVIALLLTSVELNSQTAQELYRLINAMWDPSAISPRNSCALFCLAKLIAADQEQCSPIDFRPGLYRLIRMTDLWTVWNAFCIFQLLGPRKIEISKIVDAAMTLFKGQGVEEDVKVTVLRTFVTFADDPEIPRVLFETEGFVGLILKLLEEGSFRIRAKCTQLLAVMIQMADPLLNDQIVKLQEHRKISSLL